MEKARSTIYVLDRTMPFHLELGSDGRSYGGKAILVNTQSGKHYSNKPIPLESAKRQMRVLEQVTAKEEPSSNPDSKYNKRK